MNTARKIAIGVAAGAAAVGAMFTFRPAPPESPTASESVGVMEMVMPAKFPTAFAPKFRPQFTARLSDKSKPSFTARLSDEERVSFMARLSGKGGSVFLSVMDAKNRRRFSGMWDRDPVNDTAAVNAFVLAGLMGKGVSVKDALKETGYILPAATAVPAAPAFTTGLGVYSGADGGWTRVARSKGYAKRLYSYTPGNWLYAKNSDIIILDAPPDEIVALAAHAAKRLELREVILTWDKLNNMDNTVNAWPGFKVELERAIKVIRLTHPNCFIWLTVCVGSHEREWVEMFGGLADGYAIWGAYKFTVEFDLLYKKLRAYGWEKPMSICGFYGHNPHRQPAAPHKQTRFAAKAREARQAGFMGFWRMAGKIPDRIAAGCDLRKESP